MKKIWFRRKTYGWGWYPVTWHGWMVLVGFVALEIANAFVFGPRGSANHEEGFLIFTGVLVVILLVICFIKGERPRWQWGSPDRK